MAHTFLKLLSVIFLSSFPFLTTLKGDFVFDDSEAIVKNKDVLSESWTDCFYNDFWGSPIKSNFSHKSYRPLTVLTFRLNYYWNSKELSAFSFKVTNLVCHVVCTVLVWCTYKLLLKEQEKTNSLDVSYIGALIFAVHPIHVEAVSGIVGLADLLSGVTFFLAFLCYNKCITSRSNNLIYLLITTILSAASMLFKENGITVLGFCIVYDIINNVVKERKCRNLSFVCDISAIIRMSFLMLCIVLLLYGRWAVMGGTKPEFKAIDNPAAFADSLLEKIATHNYIYFLNALLFIWPQWLCYDWSMGCVPLITNVLDYRLIFPCLLYMYAVYFVIKMCDMHINLCSKRSIIHGVALTIIPFLPAANVFYPVGFVIAERILYIPSAGYCLLIALGLQKIYNKSKNYKLSMIFFVFLISIYGLRSWQRSEDWRNEYQLFISGLSVCPLNAKVHYNIAKASDFKNDTEAAFASYKESLRLFPEYYQAMNNLANMLKNQRKFSDAESHLRKALKIKPDFPAAWMNLGIVLANTKRLKEGELAYKTALRYRKNYPDCLYNLGNLYLEMNKTNDAIEQWLHAVNLNNKHILAWSNLIAFLDNTDQFDKALQIIPKALMELPDSPSINFAVANIYGKMERFEEAEKHFLDALKLFGRKVQAIHYANLGVLYHRWKKYDAAETMYKNALNIDPAFKSAIRNLNSLHKLQKKSRLDIK